jgi:hypothetical protein
LKKPAIHYDLPLYWLDHFLLSVTWSGSSLTKAIRSARLPDQSGSPFQEYARIIVTVPAYPVISSPDFFVVYLDNAVDFFSSKRGLISVGGDGFDGGTASGERDQVFDGHAFVEVGPEILPSLFL